MKQENISADLNVKIEVNLYYDFYKPEKTQKPAPLLISVHGYGAHKGYMMREARLIAPENFAIASIQAPHQHFRQTDNGYKVGFGWLTDYKSEESVTVHHEFILKIIDRLSKDNLTDASRIFLYGFSQACALNFRFAFTYPDIVSGVTGICGGIPSDLKTNKIYKPTAAGVFYLYSRNDEFYPLEKFEKYDAELKNFLPDYTSKSYDAGHEITQEMRDDVKIWLAERAENQLSQKSI